MISNKNRLLLVEDDVSLGYLLSEYLKIKGFEITWVTTGHAALKVLDEQIFHLAILDVSMPDIDGFSLALKIKDQCVDVPFMFLTARSMKVDVLKGFSIGAVDYIKKPIDEEELVARIEALLSRLEPAKIQDNPVASYAIGKYTFNASSQMLEYNGVVTKLTSRENELLKMLIKNKNQLCSHKDVLVSIWGKNDYFNRKSLNVFISHLRKYLSEDRDIKIENVHRQGFILHIRADQ